MPHRVLILAAALLSLAASLPRAALGAPAVAEFAALPNHSMMRLSPSGRYVAAKVQLGDRYGLVVYDLERRGQQPYVMSAGVTEVRWHRWASDERLLVSVQRAGQRGAGGVPSMEVRLIAIDPDGSNGVLLTPTRMSDMLIQIGDSIVDMIHDDPDHILMSFNPDDPARPRLYRVNIHTARRSLVAAGRSDVSNWTVDQQLRPRLGSGIVNNSTWRVVHRAPDSRRWEVLLEHPVDDGSLFVPLHFDPDDPDLLYVRSNHDNGIAGLFTYRLSSRQFSGQIYQDAEREVAGVIVTRDGRGIAGIVLSDDDDNVIWLDPRHETLAAQVASLLSASSVTVASTSDDLSRAIAITSATDQPPRYYLFNAADGTATYLAPTYPALEEQPLAPMRAVEYEARDGLRIPGYLTLPAGVSGQPTAPLPAVVMPHGGPHSRDFAQFDPLLQLLASRGYAVLQMNFRGSSGFGAEFEAAGYRQWGQAMQDDVTDGTRWLVAQGIADPERICIVGGSYGGYAALMGVVKEPDLYACAVSINGLSDLPRMISHLNNYVGGRTAARFIGGNTLQDQRQLRENSPVNRTAEIVAPVLLMAGSLDRVVPPEQSRVMARALRRADKPHEYIELEGGGHSFVRADHRLTYFSELDRFLAQHLAPAVASADPAP